ncbi:hypothetical protein ACCO45_005057 [Purpureocillium lilacinum]|uniref:Uncharacterized protein n=1 Tax=Purpureocillium lilacinum TaxID=33203 RepID=A0ACC4DUC7_PURLI
MPKQDDDVASAAQDNPQHQGQESKDAAAASPPASEPDTAAENDSFEDAVDAVSVRSLTKRSASASKSPPPPDAEQQDTKSDADDTGDVRRDSSGTDSKSQPRRSSSPISKRISHDSNLDNVDLDDEAPAKAKAAQPCRKRTVWQKAVSGRPHQRFALHALVTPSRVARKESETIVGRSGLTASRAQATASDPEANKSLLVAFAQHFQQQGQPNLTPVQASPRRNTASSIATLMSNPEMMLSRLEEESEGTPNGGPASNRESLRDRFKAVRMREEAGIAGVGGESDGTGDALGLVNQAGDASPTEKTPTQSLPGPDKAMAPGTASGVNAGPSAMPDTQVDWDLWQSVVYEGPAAVARTSAEELNKAIATGIPNAIRGVIWQVLAQSKNEDLELVYRELAARGTDKDKNRQSNSTTSSTVSNGNLSTHSGDAASSASSVHSEQSAGNGSSSPRGEKSAEAIAKAQAVATAERKKREKEDTAALQKLEKTIRRDLGGTYKLLQAYALFDEGVGYAQGMNFLIMPLLFNMPEQEAFCLLVRMMNHYHLRDLFIQDMPGLHMHLYQFERLLEDVEPALYCHLHRRGVSPHLYATQWFLTLFAYRFPLQLVLRIYDLILSEGLSAILRFGIVLMQKNASTLLAISDMQQLTTHLKDKLFDLKHGQGEVYRADQLVRDACEVKITPETLKLYTTEWEEKTKAERDREIELLELRAANQNFAIQVRKLEERVQVCDREQAALATELVHTKVENEELRDENESLKGQVRELKVVIEQQPAEIEEKWNMERDDLMKRNGNVHEENQRLEKEMSELEEELVQTKMQYAEINSQHEALTRKWADLKRQFS